MNKIFGRTTTWLVVFVLLLGAVYEVIRLRQPDDSSVTILQRNSHAERGVHSEASVIETELLPLSLTADRVANRIDIAIGGGAIQVIGDTILIMDRLGRIFVYKEQQISSSEIPDLPLHLKEFSANGRFPVNESTLRAHDLKYDKERNVLYASYDAYDTELRGPRFTVSRIALTKNSMRSTGSWEVIFQSAPIPLTTYYAGRGAGGKMLATGEKLYFVVGDYSLDRVVTSTADIAAQNPRSEFGKAYCYDLTKKLLKVISSGLRSPEGLAVISSGDILETEHGPRGGDELNVIAAGMNYGWPYISYGTRYFSYRPYLDATEFRRKTTVPMYAWVPSVAVTALIESNSFFPGWKGDIIVGSLKAQSLFRLKIIQGRVIFAEPIWIGYRVRDVAERGNQLIIWSDDGSILFLAPDRKLLATDRLNVEVEYGKSALAECSTCHSFAIHNPFYWAPSLNNIYGRRIGGDKYQNYSDALRNKKGVWNEGALTAFLLDPQKFAPGTSMINPDLTPDQVLEIVAALKGVTRQ
jgi:glucose/arabinose dehydrogenase/cytochrome c2